MVCCSVPDCEVNHRNNPNNETFHRFPSNALVKEKWIRILNRPNWTPHKYSTVCSKHFESTCFIRQRLRCLLKKDSVPTKFVPVTLKPKRPVSTYVFRDISPQPSTSQAPQLTPRKKKLINKCAKLKNKLTEKQRNIRNLKAKNKRMKAKVVTLQLVLDEFKKRPGLKNHINEISLACSNEMLQNLVDRVNEKNAGKISHSKEYSINTSLKYNKITKEFELKNEEQDEESSSLILNKLPNNIEDLTLFVKSVVHYIAGFVVKKIKKHVHCEECIQSLLQSRSNYMSSLISKKDFLLYGEGFLVYPSNDVIFVCEQSEHYFRRFIKTNFYFNKRLYNETILKLLRHIDTSNLFEQLTVHSYEQDTFESHRYLVIKYIIETYITVRLRYETTCETI